MPTKNTVKEKSKKYENLREGKPIKESEVVRLHNNNKTPQSEIHPAHLGKMKGIQGKDNSCYADSFLMSLFYTTAKFDEIFHLNKVAQNEPEIQSKFVTYLKAIVLQLRKANFCESGLISPFRKNLSKMDKRFADGNMMDVIDLLSTLSGTKGLNIYPFLTYDTGTSNFYHQITVSAQDYSNKIDLQTLLEKSLEYQKLKIASISAPCLFVKMPRSAGKLVGFKAIIPVDTLKIQMSKEKKARRFTLHAVICLLHCHYTAFIKTSEGSWIFFDSMAELNTPAVSDAMVVNELLSNQAVPQPKSIVDRLDKSEDPMVEHMVSNCHLCIYVDKGNSTTVISAPLDNKGMNRKNLDHVKLPIDAKQTSHYKMHEVPSTVKVSLQTSEEVSPPAKRQGNTKIENNSLKVSSSSKSKAAKKEFEPETRKIESMVVSMGERNNPNEAEDMDVPDSLEQRGFHVQSFKSSLASLQYALWCHTTVFNDSFDENVSTMKEKIKSTFIDPLQSTGKCNLDKFDPKEIFSVSVSAGRWPEPVVFLNKMQFRPMIPARISGDGSVYFELQDWASPNNLVKLDDAIRQTQRSKSKLGGMPHPAFIVARSGQSKLTVLPNLTLNMKEFVEDQKQKVEFQLHAVICKAQSNFYVLVRTEDSSEENGNIWIRHDPTQGKEKQLTLDVGITNCKKLVDLKDETRSMYENGCMWIYVPRQRSSSKPSSIQHNRIPPV